MGAAKETFAIGIDLGTTYSCVGIWRSDRVEIIADKENIRHTPSCVAFTEDFNEDDNTYTNRRLIGEDAVNEDDCSTTNIIYDSKRLIGRRFSEETVQNDMKRWPFKVIQGSNDKPMITVTCENKGETKKFAPEEISAMVLGRLKKTVEEYLSAEVTDAVITVPAYFDQSQRQATIDAGKIAGLNVLRLLNEPTAAAVAYTLNLDHDIIKEKKVLVFDLGGGTFDVSCLVVTNNKIEVKAVGGDSHLGGQDFVNRMVDHFVGIFKTKHKMLDIGEDQTALRKLKKACERGKRSLSSDTSTNIHIEFLRGKSYKERLTRAKFEELNLDLFKKCMDGVEKCLIDANMDKNEVDDVVLIGGSSSIPKIREMLSELMNKNELYKRIDPFEAVASGAAVQAALLSGRGSGKIQKLMLLDVTPLSLGVEIVGDVMRVLIPKNTSIPARSVKCFTTVRDYQTDLVFLVYEGERARSKDNKLLGQLELTGIKRALRRVPNVDVCFNLQADGILEVTAKDRDTGKEISATMKGMKLPRDEIQRMIKESKEYEASDEMFKKKGETRNEFEIYACGLRDDVNSEHNMKAGAKEKAKKAIDEALEWLDSKVQLAEVSEYEERKKKLMSVVDEARKGNWS